MKKLLNDPFDFVEESLEGFLLAHSDWNGKGTVTKVNEAGEGMAGHDLRP